MLFAALTNSVCLNNASFFFLFKYFLCQGYELSGEIALKNNHYYYYYYNVKYIEANSNTESESTRGTNTKTMFSSPYIYIYIFNHIYIVTKMISVLASLYCIKELDYSVGVKHINKLFTLVKNIALLVMSLPHLESIIDWQSIHAIN